MKESWNSFLFDFLFVSALQPFKSNYEKAVKKRMWHVEKGGNRITI